MTAQLAMAMEPAKESVPARRSPGDRLEQFDCIYDSIARGAFELFEGDGRRPRNDLR